jgi:hypothetical protein
MEEEFMFPKLKMVGAPISVTQHGSNDRYTAYVFRVVDRE